MYKKNTKGFTLVEVLTTIVILGILSVVAIAGVQTVMQNGRNKYYKSLKEMIIAAAKEYYSDHKSDLPVDIDEKDEVYVTTLIDDDYLDPVKDAHGKGCSDEGKVIVYKRDAKTYDYLLSNFECPDKSMPELNDENQSAVADGKIDVDCKPYSGGKKARAILTLNGRSDYRYTISKKGIDEDNSKYKEVADKKGNIKDGKNEVKIELNYGSGNYRVEVQTGDGSTKSQDSCEITVDSPEPDCDGIEYEINRVAKEWFKGDLKVTVKTDKEKMERYNINGYQVVYNNFQDKEKSSTKGLSATDKEITANDIKNKNYAKEKITIPKLSSDDDEYKKDFTYTRDISKGTLSIFIYNDNDKENPKECKLGEYWMDNDKPECVDMTVNDTWTNDPNFFVTTGCDDHDVSNEKSSVLESGCQEKDYKDDKEGDITNIVIEDKVGNKTTCTFSKKKDITAPTCKALSNYNKQWHSNAISSRRVAWVECDDPLDWEGKKLSGCTVPRQEDDTEGDVTIFTLEDGAGNKTVCSPAEKYIDNTKPSCGTRSTYNGRWSFNNTAWVDCNDQPNLSKCTQSRFQNTPTDGRIEKRIVIKDNAGNTENCDNIEKYRDTVAPKCSYTADDPKLNLSKSTERDAAGNSLSNEMFKSFTVNAKATCTDVVNPDGYSDCKQPNYTATQTSSSSVAPDITVEDNAGNSTKCTKTNIKNITQVGCPTRTVSGGPNPGVWTNKITTIALKFPGSISIKGWPSSLPSYTGSGTNYSVKYASDGAYAASTYKVCDKNYSSYCANCQMPAVKLDTKAPQCTYYPGTPIKRTTTRTERENTAVTTNEFFDHFELSATATCTDVANPKGISDCKQKNYSATTTSKTSTRTPDITVEDNAGNSTKCTNNSSSNSMTPVSCPSREISDSAETWLHQGTTLKLTFDTNTDLRLFLPAGAYVSGSGKNYTVNYTGEGDYPATTYEACIGNDCVNCQLPPVKIDWTPPTLSYQYSTIDWGSDERCRPGMGEPIKSHIGKADFVFHVNYYDVNAYDSVSGVQWFRYHVSPTFHWREEVVGKDFNSLGVKDPNEKNTRYMDSPYYNGQKSVTVRSYGFTVDMNSMPDVGDHTIKYCYAYCVGLNAYDVAGNKYESPVTGEGGVCSWDKDVIRDYQVY